MLKRFLSYYKPHKRIFTLDMLASLAIALIAMVYPIVTRRMMNDLIPNKNYSMILMYGSMLLLAYILRALLKYFVQYYGHVMGVEIQAEMRRDMFRHQEKLPFAFFDSHETGNLMSRMTNDLMDISELAHHGPENIIISTISIVASFLYLSHINLILTIIIFSCLPLLAVISVHLHRRMRRAFADSRKSTGEINASLENSISGIRVTKAFTNAEKELEKFEKGNTRFVQAKVDAYKAMGMFFSSTSFITDVFNVIVLMAGGFFLYRNQISFGDYSAFIVSINIFITPVNSLIQFMEQYQNGITGFERFLEIMDAQPEYQNPDATPLENVQGDIVFEGVTFSYEQDEAVLDNLSLHVESGKTLALVGPSGGGKTTICHIIPNFYQIESGRVLIDGQDIRSLTLDSLRKNIGIVQQDIYLFNASIRENIHYGRLDATDEEIIEAAKMANIHDYIMSLEDGYDTQIGERGARLSGGQKQRLSIARVFLKNPPILILDEATSALDNTTEILIQEALDKLCKGRTTIVVAHRLSTIKNAHEIAVIDNGHIVELGTHEALVGLEGVYSKLYNMQFRG
ncbi:ABC transporter ATP-binding protein [Oscillospiraceae bacterium MB08-C2-2]|nr:ABC transporter ATP-binding protein [Oscillospiraceae bacterium MB08-C2-2]